MTQSLTSITCISKSRQAIGMKLQTASLQIGKFLQAWVAPCKFENKLIVQPLWY